MEGSCSSCGEALRRSIVAGAGRQLAPRPGSAAAQQLLRQLHGTAHPRHHPPRTADCAEVPRARCTTTHGCSSSTATCSLDHQLLEKERLIPKPLPICLSYSKVAEGATAEAVSGTPAWAALPAAPAQAAAAAAGVEEADDAAAVEAAVAGAAAAFARALLTTACRRDGVEQQLARLQVWNAEHDETADIDIVCASSCSSCSSSGGLDSACSGAGGAGGSAPRAATSTAASSVSAFGHGKNELTQQGRQGLGVLDGSSGGGAPANARKCRTGCRVGSGLASKQQLQEQKHHQQHEQQLLSPPPPQQQQRQEERCQQQQQRAQLKQQQQQWSLAGGTRRSTSSAVRQAAPMVLNLDDLAQSSIEVLEMELGRLDLQQLKFLKDRLLG